jgi:hypothetical protein
MSVSGGSVPSLLLSDECAGYLLGAQPPLEPPGPHWRLAWLVWVPVTRYVTRRMNGEKCHTNSLWKRQTFTSESM